jgi:alanyl-tRNA synthetase
MTQKLFIEDPYLQTFSSTIVEHIWIDEKPAVILDRTGFYPTSGGQPHDTGWLNDVAVVDVIEDEHQRIVHLLEKPIDETSVKGRIDWPRRFDHMQQHTGQHIMSQAFMKICQAETIAFHLGEKSSTIDVSKPNLTLETVAAVENLTNQIIFENREVRAHFVAPNEIDRFPVRKPPTVKADIRVIEIGDFDYSPCGGTHCRHTGEVGIFKVSRFENYKGGSRIHFLCGQRALKDYQHAGKILKKLSETLSSNVSDLPLNVEKLKEDAKRLHLENNNLKKRLLEFEAQTLTTGCEKREKIRVLTKIFQDRHPKELQILASKILASSPNTVILFGAKEAREATLLFACSDNLTYDMGELMQTACPVIEGRGGGRPRLAQGGGARADKIEEALQCAQAALFDGHE